MAHSDTVWMSNTDTVRIRFIILRSAALPPANSTWGFGLKYALNQLVCGGRIQLTGDATGEQSRLEGTQISSPDYPQSHNGSVNCDWIVLAPRGRVIRFDIVRSSFQITK
ncbi:unnamed protein product [Protopolystoma xenopodis]|uniref:CUB domain-containing protein n=1 Tax=Protopolystoma xenopodis TaxID=117903 RepID=A0A3S5CJU2_9PLAT|nr:unnamed protein product [Protopolystoma xenopodis]